MTTQGLGSTYKQPDQLCINNPTTGEELYRIPCANAQEIANTFSNSHQAFDVVKQMTLAERLTELEKFKQALVELQDDIEQQIHLETGKPKYGALTELMPVILLINYYQKNAHTILAEKKSRANFVFPGMRTKLVYEPLGPILVISPWNYPLVLSLLPIVCAFVAGNSVIWKPSEVTPLYGLLEKIIEKSHFVKNAIQIIYGDKNTGVACIEHKPAKIMFTGSTDAGKKVMAHAANYLIPVDLELGGKDPMIVFDDVTIDNAANIALYGGYSHGGQVCSSTERLYVHERIYEDFIKELQDKMAKLVTPSKIDNSAELPYTDYGVITAQFQCEKIKKQLTDAIEKGATILTGGNQIPQSREFEPTLISDVNSSMLVLADETFGPIMTVQKFATEEQVIALANNNKYGLSASILTKDLTRAERVAKKLVVGNVSINTTMAIYGNPHLPYGGIKSSGFGRYMGAEGLHNFSNIKSILINKHTTEDKLVWFPYTKEKYNLIKKLPALVANFSLKNLWRLFNIDRQIAKLRKKQKY